MQGIDSCLCLLRSRQEPEQQQVCALFIILCAAVAAPARALPASPCVAKAATAAPRMPCLRSPLLLLDQAIGYLILIFAECGVCGYKCTRACVAIADMTPRHGCACTARPGAVSWSPVVAWLATAVGKALH
jgi:hypothetical protein